MTTLRINIKTDCPQCIVHMYVLAEMCKNRMESDIRARMNTLNHHWNTEHKAEDDKYVQEE